MFSPNAPDIYSRAKKYDRDKKLKEAGVYAFFRTIDDTTENKVNHNGRWLIQVASNDYLGLSQHPKIKEAAKAAIDKFGTSCTGSRFLNGTISLHLELESKLANLYNKKSAIVFSTGFFANSGTISTITGKNDFIFSDRENHASITEGCQLSFAKTLKFKHNNTEDLERLLKANNGQHGKLIVSDGVFSMSGDIAHIPELVRLAKKYEARLMIDEAHSVGVLGSNGLGSAEEFESINNVDIIMGTFSKSLASVGGFIASDVEATNYVKHVSRELMFTASLPPASTAAVIAALDILCTEPERRTRLHKNIAYMIKGFEQLGFKVKNRKSPIVPIFIGDLEKTLKMGKMLEEEGVFTNLVLSPGVPAGEELIRTSYKATHTQEELDFVLEKFEKVGKKLEII